eukprot:scaffold280835_cov18-Tisochrysis_lutea.AAC.2
MQTFQQAYAKMSAEQKQESKTMFQAAREFARIAMAIFKLNSRIGRLAFAQQDIAASVWACVVSEKEPFYGWSGYKCTGK